MYHIFLPLGHSEKSRSLDTLFNEQINFICKLMAWNGFPSHVRKYICNKFLKQTKKTDRTLVEKPTLWLNLPYLGKSGQFLVNNLEKKLNKSLSDFKLKVMYKTNKLAMFCSNKDKLIPLNKGNVV